MVDGPRERSVVVRVNDHEEVAIMRIVRFIGAVIGLLVATAVIVPLVVLAGLFVWLKLTEEADEEALELEQEAAI
jgi:hypothetical protein